MSKREEIDANSRVIEKLCNVQHKFGFTDKQMVQAVARWYIEIMCDTSPERGQEMNQAEELHELRQILAALVHASGNSPISVSRTDLEASKAQVSRLVRQWRIDGSGVDIYCFEEPRLK